MAVTLIVETGTGSATANAYASLAAASAYLERQLYAGAWLDADEDRQSAALVWATQLLDERIDWAGTPATTTQALGWPRAYCYDRLGRAIEEDVVPAAVVNATAEFAWRLLTEDRTELADKGGVVSQTVGPLSVTYGAGGSARGVIPTSVALLLGPLVAPRIAMRA